MKKLIVLLAVAASSCAGMKVVKEPPKDQPKPTGGITWGGSPVSDATGNARHRVGKFEVTKVGYWCDARHGILTFGAFGATEAEARVSATNTCLRMYKDGPCEVDHCKPEAETKPGTADPSDYVIGRTLPGDGEERGTWHSIYKAKQGWTIDIEKKKFVEATAKGVTCHLFSGCGTGTP